MYTRLACSVAAHLDAEIMLVDEGLAVGDMGFQTQCLERMRQVAAEERTVLLVSHDMAAVNRPCDRAVLLDMGRTAFIGSTEDCILRYERLCGVPPELPQTGHDERGGSHG